MGAGPTASWTRRAIHLLCLTALAAWIALALPRLMPELGLVGCFVLAALVAYDVASEVNAETRRIVFVLSCVGYVLWVASAANPLSREVVQTAIEALLVVAVVESRNLVMLLVLLIASLFVGLLEASQIYSPAGFERMLWLAQAWLIALVTFVRGMRRV